MKAPLLILTISICLTGLTGCASLFQGIPGDDWDSTPTSQAAPEQREPLDFNSEDYHRNQVVHAIEARDIVPGMSPQEVISAWGRPREVETAGDSRYGNQRWVYYDGNSLHYGISQQRIIYFENGRVAGWESR